jgi:hypothetical protein
MEERSRGMRVRREGPPPCVHAVSGGGRHASMHACGAHLALVVVLKQFLRVRAARELALLVGAVEHVLPELLAKFALRLERALLLRLLALSAVPQEEEPPLLLGHRALVGPHANATW